MLSFQKNRLLSLALQLEMELNNINTFANVPTITKEHHDIIKRNIESIKKTINRA